MPIRETVRDAQRRLVALDADYVRAVARFNRASVRRAEVLADQDRLVAFAQENVEQTVAVMADAVGAQLTASVLGLDEADVRRVAKSRKPRYASSDAEGADRVFGERARRPGREPLTSYESPVRRE